MSQDAAHYFLKTKYLIRKQKLNLRENQLTM